MIDKIPSPYTPKRSRKDGPFKQRNKNPYDASKGKELL